MLLRIGGAPISWGVCEIPGWGSWPPYERVLDEVAAAGFEGTELGPWGFLPADPGRLAAELDRRGLAVASGFVPLKNALVNSTGDGCNDWSRDTLGSVPGQSSW